VSQTIKPDHLPRDAFSGPADAGGGRATRGYPQLERALSATLRQIGDLVARGRHSDARAAMALARAIEDELSGGEINDEEYTTITPQRGDSE